MTIVRTAIDAWAREGLPNANYGGRVRLWVNGGAAGNDRMSYLQFARPFPLGASILSAKLQLRLKGAWSGSQTLTAKRITGKWSESRLTWANRPTASATNPGAVVVASGVDGQLVEIDLTAMMQDVSSGGAYFGIRLELGTDVDRALNSSEAVDASLRPVLEVVWSMPPDAPTNLAPAGARAISIAKPILSWRFSDPDSGASQSSSQVQIDDAADFATPIYDSGKVANTVQLWDLGPTAFAGFAADDVRWWRVRVYDEADIMSAWSDPVQLSRKTKGTLTLTGPAGATVDSLTPSITWTFTGRTQEAYQVILYRVDAGGGLAELWNTGKVVSTSLASSIPEDLIFTGTSYRVLLRVWDTLDRQAIAGDPDYSEATRDFTYARSGVPAAVTALTATIIPTAQGPGVQLDWTRTTVPDFFSVKRDGVEVPGLTRILPADVLVSGSNYRLKVWVGTPRGAHTWEVEAVVAAAGVLQHGDANATDTETTDPTGIWLVDTDDGLAVRIAGGDDTLNAGIGEAGATHHLPGSRVPVRITESVRGFEGDVAGVLTSKADRDTFLELKGRLKPLRMIVSDLNIPVELEEVAAPPTKLSDDRLYGCSFGFFQVGEFTFDVAGG